MRFDIEVGNAGTQDLVIQGLYPSCGCTSAEPTPLSIPPGASRKLGFLFKGSGLKGILQRTVEILSNDGERPRTFVTYQVDVIPEAAFHPEELLLSTREKAARAYIQTMDGRPLKILEASAPATPHLEVIPIEDPKLGVGLKVTLLQDLLPKGRTQGHETILVRTHDPQAPLLTLIIRWSVP